MTKKIWAMILALAMCASLLAGCGSSETTTAAPSESASEEKTEAPATDAPATTEAPADTTAEVTEEDTTEAAEEPEDGVIDLHDIKTAVMDAEAVTLDHSVYAGIPGKDYTDEKVYTFNDSIADTSTLNWNPLSWETHDDDVMLSFLSSGLYEYVLNEAGDSWSVIPEMAAEYPVDVTADYAGKYGVEAGESGKAWKIALNPDACWEDGTPINADTYIYSYQQLLDPAQLNRRADTMYAGSMPIVGAKAYFNQGGEAFTPLGTDVAEWLAAGNNEADLYVDAVGFWNAAGYVDKDGNEIPKFVSVADETIYSVDGTDAEDQDPFSGKMLYDQYLKEGAPYQSESANYLGTVESFGETSWDEVGILKTGDYEIVVICEKVIDNPEYMFMYNFYTGLVYEPLFEQLKVVTNGVYSTTYGTSQKATMSYGPYRMDYFEQDKKISFTRNENWYGYKDGKHTGQYQTDNYVFQVINKHETELLAFRKGEIDGVSLQAEDMEEFGSSPYIRYTPQDYTTKLTFNTDVEALSARGAQILSNQNFRKAFSLAIDRNTFASSYTSAGSAGYGLLNYMYIYNPFTGETYRDSDAAKAALCDLYGLTYGDDGDFDDLDEAYDAITGYDMEQAKALMVQAYDEVTTSGLWDGTTPVELTMSVYQNDDIYVKMFNYLNTALQEACKGSGFEGKVSLVMKVDPDYYETIRSGNTDIIFSTWGGASYEPFSILFQCYMDKNNGQIMEYGFDADKVEVKLTIDGKEYTQNLTTWALWMDDSDKNLVITSDDGSVTLERFGAYDAQTKCAFLGVLENEYLKQYVVTPIYYRNVGSMVSQKGDYPLQTYADLISFGGIRFYTFNYDDTEWAEVAKTLKY